MEISAGTVKIETRDGAMSSWLSRPQGGGKHPAIIVVMEAFGLNQHIKNVADRLAKEGYVVLAPDLYHRETNTVVGYDELPAALSLMSSLYDERILSDISTAVTYLQAQSDVHADRI